MRLLLRVNNLWTSCYSKELNIGEYYDMIAVFEQINQKCFIYINGILKLNYDLASNLKPLHYEPCQFVIGARIGGDGG